MKRYGDLEKRIARLQPEPEWVDNDSDNFLTSINALPGESGEDALRRRAREVWKDYNRADFSEVDIDDDE